MDDDRKVPSIGSDRLALGRLGESVAADFLERSGWTVLERNYRAGRKEVDLIIRRGKVVAFVEVKARRGPECGHPLEAITWRKRRDIMEVARAWRARNPRVGRTLRFDAVSVLFGPGRPPEVRHVGNAWTPGL
jgi:putative endonuclease